MHWVCPNLKLIDSFHFNINLELACVLLTRVTVDKMNSHLLNQFTQSGPAWLWPDQQASNIGCSTNRRIRSLEMEKDWIWITMKVMLKLGKLKMRTLRMRTLKIRTRKIRTLKIIKLPHLYHTKFYNNKPYHYYYKHTLHKLCKKDCLVSNIGKEFQHVTCSRCTNTIGLMDGLFIAGCFA